MKNDMKRLLRAAAAVACALSLPAVAQHTTTVTAAAILTGGNGSGGTPMAHGTVCATAVNQRDQQISVTETGWGLLLSGKRLCAPVTAGSLGSGLPVPDASHTNFAAAIDYDFEIQQTDASGNAIGIPVTIRNVPGVTGSTFALDTYAPAGVVLDTAKPGLGYGSSVPSNCVAPAIWVTPAGLGYTCVGGVYVQFGGGSASNPRLCATNTATSKCADLAPYYASGDGATTTTTTSSASSGATVLHVASCASWSAGQGVLATGAAINTVASCSGTTMTLTSGLSAGVSSGAAVVHDNTTAIQAAWNDLAATGGDVYLPCGLFLASGPHQDTGGANAVLKVPNVLESDVEITVTLHGCEVAVGGKNSFYGTVLQTAVNTGNFIGGYDASSTPFGPFTNVKLGLDKLTLRAPDNPGIVMVNAHWINEIEWNHVRCDTMTNVPSTNTAGVCMEAPSLSSDVGINLDDIYVLGFYTDWILGEHAHAKNLYAGGGHNCLVPDVRDSRGPSYAVGNMVKVDYFWHQTCVNAIATGTTPTTVDITMDSEVATNADINDPNGYLTGKADVRVPYADGRSPSTPTQLTVIGGANLNVCNLTTSACTKGSSNVSAPTVAGSCSATASVLITVSGTTLQIPTCGLPASLETWNANAGSGTSFANTGTDSTNSATFVSGTWGSTSGFTGSAAQFDGTTSYAAASSATNTAFTGSTPFSVCAYINETNAPGGSIVDTYNDTTSSFLGWNFGTSSAGAGVLSTSFALVHDVATNNYLLAHPSSTFAVGSTHHVCVTYDGSQNTSGVDFYTDGVHETTVSVVNSLTSTAANTVPVVIGANKHGAGVDNFFAGSIGYVHIFNFKLSAGQVTSIYAAGTTAY